MSSSLPRRRLLHAALASPLLALPPAQAQPNRLQDLLDERVRLEGMGLAAAQVLEDGTLQLSAAGRSGVGEALLTPDRHRLEIGSITKPFIGLLLADAVLRGELKLDDPLEASLPEGLALRDSAGQPLRWVDVATHRSGLPRLPSNWEPANPLDPYADFGDPQMLAALRAFQPKRRRDEAFEYSNFGYGLMGWLLARRAQQPLGRLLDVRVLEPLGLGGPQGMSLRPAEGPAAVQGHDAQGKPTPAWTFDALAGAGALRASAAQLARFAQAMLGHPAHPLRDAAQLALQVHSALGPRPGMAMGLAWMRLQHAGRDIATHDGGTFGFSSSLWLDLTKRRAGLALANAQVVVTDLAGHLTDPAARLRDIAAERRAAEQALAQPAQTLSDEQLAALAGVYALNPQFKVTVRVEVHRVFGQATGQGEFELFAKSERQLFARITPLEMHFDAGSPSPAFTLLQGGGKLRFVRESAP